MIKRLIRWSVENRFVVILLAAVMTGWGVYAVQRIPIDAIPDLSDVQVIIKTGYAGQAPQVVEDQVTYPLTTAMLAVPKAVAVRGYSFFGDSYVYVIFEDGTDLYWARARVLEYLSQAASRLPASAKPALGPDATGVGWVYQYALVDRSGQHDLAQLRSIQDWFLKFELQTVPGVSEVATIGGMVRQYQVVVDPNRLRAFGLHLAGIKAAIVRGNQEVGGSVIEMAEAEYMVRSSGYVSTLESLRDVPVGVGPNGTPITLDEIADIQFGPQMRRGVSDLNGEGEVAGGVIVMRWGENALATIERVKVKLNELRAGLPPGVEIVETYDRSTLIQAAADNLTRKLTEEMIVVALICAAFLFHLRSSLVIIVSLPIGVLMAFAVMQTQGINANVMSLGGIAIAVGAMVDGAVVMVENVHKHLEKDSNKERDRWEIVVDAAQEVGPALFFSILIITLSFIPVFALQAQEGRLFKPLAFTKTYAMAASAILAVTLVPVLMGYFIRGRIVKEQRNPLNRLLIWMYRPFIKAVVKAPLVVIVLAVLVTLSTIYPLSKLGGEFMPELDEGDLLYMPSAFPGVSIGKITEVLQQTDRLIKIVPEVASVHGKAGRADTATDPAPLTMIETVIRLKPRDQWRPGMTMQRLRDELDTIVQVPGLTNVWTMPIKNRTDMLATGIKTPVGIKISGPDLNVINNIGGQIERALASVPGVSSVFAERPTAGRFIDVDIDRRAAARFGLNIADVQLMIAAAVGGVNIADSVEGLERYPINLRYPRELRDSLEDLRQLPLISPTGAQVPLGQVASISINDGPGLIRSENARPNGWVYIDVADRDVVSVVNDAQQAVSRQIDLPPRYALTWSGQYEYIERAKARLMVVIPVVLIVILVLLYLNFRSTAEVAIIVGTVPLALVGGVWLLHVLDYNLSVAVGVGFIALAGVAVETGVLMLTYLDRALQTQQEKVAAENRVLTLEDLDDAVTNGALLRVRPIMMTVATIIVGLITVMMGEGTGSEVMRRIAAPMVGGMTSALVLTLIVIPAVYVVWKRVSVVRE